jgi:hypothetical protein
MRLTIEPAAIELRERENKSDMQNTGIKMFLLCAEIHFGCELKQTEHFSDEYIVYPLDESTCLEAGQRTCDVLYRTMLYGLQN